MSILDYNPESLEYFYNDTIYTQECREGNFSNAFNLISDYKITAESLYSALLNDSNTNKELQEKMYKKISQNKKNNQDFLS